MYFCDSSSKPFLLPVLKEQTSCSKDYDSRLGLCTRQIDDFPSHWSFSNSRSSSPSAMFFS